MDRELLARKRAVEGDLLRLPGVHAVGLGGKVADGRPTGGIAVQVYVVHKRPGRELDPGQRIPSEIGGIPTDVVEMPVPRRAAEDLKEYNPLRGGIAIEGSGPPTATGEGTLGCFARTNDADRVVVGLTNSHVIGADENAPVRHPTAFDCGECCATTVIGRVLNAVDTLHVTESGLPDPPASGEGSLPVIPMWDPPRPPYVDSAVDQVDAAIFRLEPGTCWYADIEEINEVRGTHDLTFDEVRAVDYQVRKRGRRTGLTFGEVIGIHLSGRHTPEGPNEVAQPYVDQLRIGGNNNIFAAGGDSGSVVVNDANEVVALLWGAGGTSALASPIRAVTTALNIEIATAEEPHVLNMVPGETACPSLAMAGGGPLLSVHVPPASLARLPLLALAEGDGGRWVRSAEEVRQLIAANRRVAAVWRNNHGPVVARCLLSDRPMPADVGGRAVGACVERILRVLSRYGSAALRADVADIRRALALEG